MRLFFIKNPSPDSLQSHTKVHSNCLDGGLFRGYLCSLNKQIHVLTRCWLQLGGKSMSLIIYLIGFAFVIGGIAWALIVAKVSTLYVMIVVVILIGVAILTGVTRTRSRD